MAGKALQDKTALTIAGFDPSSGAGVTADLAVFAAHGVFGTSALTALTVQSTTGVRRVEAVSPALLTDTLACLHEDVPPDGIKIGMLGGAELVDVVVRYLRQVRADSLSTWVVLDPVLRSSSGAELLSAEGVALLQSDLLPLVDVITPNTVELAALTGHVCTTQEGIEEASRALAEKCPQIAILATGGHRVKPDDTLLYQDRTMLLRGDWVTTRATHGTGCALSSALLCGLLRGFSIPDAAAMGKAYVAEAMRRAVPRGSGSGPLHLLWPMAGQPLG